MQLNGPSRFDVLLLCLLVLLAPRAVLTSVLEQEMYDDGENHNEDYRQGEPYHNLARRLYARGFRAILGG